MRGAELTIRRFTKETVEAGDLTIQIDFPNDDEIGSVLVRRSDEEGDKATILDLDAETLERIADVVADRRKARTNHVVVCAIHGYAKPSEARSWQCGSCYPSAPKAAPSLVAVEATVEGA